MCMPSTPKAPPPLAAAPKLPAEINKGASTTKTGQQSTIKTGPRGIYQPMGGTDYLGQ